MPRGCKSEHWNRAVALREARASIERDMVQLTNWVQLLTDQLEILQEEEQHLASIHSSAQQVPLPTFPQTAQILVPPLLYLKTAAVD